MYKLERYAGNPSSVQPTLTEFEKLSDLVAHVRATDNLSDDEFAEFLILHAFSRADRAIVFYEVS